MTAKTRKPENWWCIETGGVLLPFTARTTKRQAVEDYLRRVARSDLLNHEHAVKLIVGRAGDGFWHSAASRLSAPREQKSND